MENVLLSSSQEQQLKQLVTLLERFRQHGDQERVEKVYKLIAKIDKGELVVAFSGHFSAGKSTMINHLVGEDILPSSPIPTSANIVKVHWAPDDYAKVYRFSDQPILFKAPYDFSTVQEYCKKAAVTEVEIGRQDVMLPKDLTIMDTPGIDSTDEAHRLSTESALHIADAVFYVMDYNHVQSELNFMYTKELLRHGVRLYLIINQIDKHQPEELSFSDYKQSVQVAFDFWDVKPAGIFFTTLKQEKHSENEFDSVKNIMKDIFAHKDEWNFAAFESSYNKLIEEHETWLDENFQNEASLLNNEIRSFTQEEMDVFVAEKRLDKQKEGILAKIETTGDDYLIECEKILQNAYLMPYETREYAEQFLQAKQSDFKIGLLFSNKKTDVERKKRRQQFADALSSQVDSQIVWHLRQLANSILEEEEVIKSEWEIAAQSLDVNWAAELLDETVKKGASVNGQYVLNYCEDVSQRIKRIAKEKWEQFLEPIIASKRDQLSIELTKIEEEIALMKKATNAKRKLIQLKDLYAKIKSEITILTGTEDHTLQQIREQSKQEEVNFISFQETFLKEQEVRKDRDMHSTHTEASSTDISEMDKIIDRLEYAIQLFKGEHYFSRITTKLQDKKETLTEQNYMIALFGAFSAGKSSFANALLGEAVLPVSPNPTTAAINRICPPTDKYSHGTALVCLKKETDMLADIAHALSHFGKSCSTLREAYELTLDLTDTVEQNEKEKVHLAFLTAFKKGFPDFQNQLGETFTTDLESFRHYVGDESQSCFVESIDLYYDCSFTRQGITLVDTPGADSINARHTGVAFDYIKNADAILFVTYYNHAFSKADREFLIQLGRVKDSFELDKMFFIVNAIDLADSQEEIEEVLDYVKEELTQNGILFPKLFGLSSKLALQEKERKNSRINQFQAEFDHFLQYELKQMGIQSAKTEYNHAIQFLDQIIQTANEDQEHKDELRKRWEQAKVEMQKVLANAHFTILTQQMEQEAKELTFYVKQRVFLRFSEFFKEAFNPAVLKKNDRSLLRGCLQELLDVVGYDFSQEMRVTSLRVEKYIQKLLSSYYVNLQKELQTIKGDITFSHIEWNNISTPDFNMAFEHIERKQLETQFRYFRNPKAFFEQDERKKMEEAYIEILSPLADEYLQEENTRITGFYLNYLEQQFSVLIKQVEQEINEQFSAFLEALEGQENVEKWMGIRNSLHSKIVE